MSYGIFHKMSKNGKIWKSKKIFKMENVGAYQKCLYISNLIQYSWGKLQEQKFLDTLYGTRLYYIGLYWTRVDLT